MITAGFYLDPALTTPIVSTLQIVQQLGASPALRVIYFGLPSARRWVERTGGGEIRMEITGDAAGDIVAALAPEGLNSAVPGVPLSLGERVDGGPAGVRQVWLRINDSTGTPGERSFSVTVPALAEWSAA
ncbi:hypothetical protein [Azonexus sp.]|jgi:hypothetical protein|uniref:hypothetical protein n=1 Tax=Azonexus sp. TaxID=1872668 RepID=UPI002823430A|nr:hypothetical protein [Azonexus sp.]MDR1995158.1 hypothetical protein [Azonexus sp.]